VTIFKKNNVAHYTAESPRRLIERLKEKETAVMNVLPTMDLLLKAHTGTPLVKLYTGNNGVKDGLDALYEYLEKHSIKQIYTYSNSEISKHLPKYLNKIIERRENLKIRVNMIAPESAKFESLPHSQHYISNNFRTVRFLPDPFIFEGTMIMGGSMAVCFSLKDNQLHTIVLESESIVKMFTQFFLYTWDSLAKV
jgi:sugar-specific transcriptional regulator TrmB